MKSYTLHPTAIAGCYEINCHVHKDNRGEFVKVFQSRQFRNDGLAIDFREEFYSRSVHGVIRGMHYQAPPYDHDKLVYCTEGRVLDVVVDLRRSQPSFRHYFAMGMSSENGKSIYIPKGCAHGFCVMSETALMIYKVTSEHAPEYDQGVRWDSFGFSWPVARPLISPRDAGLPPLSELATPFD